MFNKIYEKVKTFIIVNKKFLIFLIVLNLLVWVELPYVVYAPGGAIDLDKRIEVKNENEAKGKLQMAYVTMTPGSIPFLLSSFIIPDWDIVSKDDLTYENEDMDDMLKKDRLEFEASVDNATISAYKMLNKELQITGSHNIVTYIDEKAETKLKLFDEILAVDGKEFSDMEEYRSIVTSHQKGDVLTLKIKRNKKEKDVKIKVYDTSDGLKTGISIVTTYDFKNPDDLKIKSKASESGPSGGMMMALGIYNALTKEDITKGKNIVGTGTIDKEGNVGEIGGIKYKLIGAVKNKADIFICPKENYEEAKKVAKEKNYDIIIITDATLEGVINDLKNL